MRRVVAFSALLLLVPVSVALSQGVEIPRPDTLGANFDHATPGAATLADYDFLVGKWTTRYQQRDPATGSYGPVVNGEWVGEKTYETLFADQFRLNRPSGRTATATYRVFNPARRVWEIQGVGVQRGVWQPGVGWSDGKDRFVVQENPATNITLRIRYYAITKDRFQWRADGSQDGGKTWVRDVILIEATRVPNM
jgi:hypothetical protein